MTDVEFFDLRLADGLVMGTECLADLLLVVGFSVLSVDSESQLPIFSGSSELIGNDGTSGEVSLVVSGSVCNGDTLAEVAEVDSGSVCNGDISAEVAEVDSGSVCFFSINVVSSQSKVSICSVLLEDTSEGVTGVT